MRFQPRGSGSDQCGFISDCHPDAHPGQREEEAEGPAFSRRAQQFSLENATNSDSLNERI
jgi:hypothetical protein